MKLPFVSRAIYEDVVRRLEQQLAAEQERTRYLTDLVADMKVGGASLVRSVATGADGRVRLEPKPKSAIHQAIDENKHASSNPRLRAHLVKWAEKELEKDASKEEAILDRLRGWHLASNNDDDDDDDDNDVVLGV